MIRIALDFDGVLHDHHRPVPGRRMGMPVEGALEAVRVWKGRGYGLVVHTTKARTESGRQAVTDWLAFYGFPALPVTDVKPDAEVYLDDRAVRFVSWAQALEEVR